MSENKTPYRIMISGGGTGGHIYPALAIAQEIKQRYPDTDFMFVGAKGRMEMLKVPAAGFAITGLWISGIQRKLTLSNLMFPIKLISSLVKSWLLVSKFKPHAVIGTGGYASGPVSIVANAKSIPLLIQEQNSFPGLTNRKLAKKAKKVCVAYDHMDRFFTKEQLVLTGNPVRNDIIHYADQKDAGLKKYNFNDNKPILMVMGGSLGARTINECILDSIDVLIESGIQVLWQTGKIYYQNILKKVKGMDLANIRVVEFIDEMEKAYAISDVVISRAGALSISELCLVGKAVIFVPSPNVSDDHQTKNAKALVDVNAALMVTDNEAPKFLVKHAVDLLNHTDKQVELGQNIRKLAKPEATKTIVDEFEKLLN